MSDDEKRFMLVSIAKRFMYSGRYEIDELVNEAWLSPSVRDKDAPPLVWLAGRWAMLAYMKKEQRFGRHIHTQSLHCENGPGFDKIVIPDNMEMVFDDLRVMLNGLSKREKDILAARFDGEQLRPLGRRFGISYERVRQIQQSALAKMRIRYQISLGERSANV